MTLTVSTGAPTRRHTRGSDHVRTLYAELQQEILAAGLMRRRYGYYAVRIALTVAMVGTAFAALVLVGHSWWQLAVAAFLGISLTQTSFLAHDSAHRQVFTTAAANEWTARLLACAVVGMSYGWWNGKHNRHHSAPNQVGKDPDVAPGVIAWTSDISAERRGLPRWLTARQGWLFFPLLLLAGAVLHLSSARALLGRAPVKRRRVEIAMVTVRLGGYLAALVLLLPPGMAIAFLAVQLAVFGLSMGMSFAPNHKGMPLVPRGATVDFLRRQVLMSRNIRGGWWASVAMGGLNLQIEHHLFPHMPRPNLVRAAPIVRDFCRRNGVTYTETSLVASYGIVMRHLNQVGLGDSDPFRCPLVQTFRAA